MKKKSIPKKQKSLQDSWELLLKKHSKPLERGAKSWGLSVSTLKIEDKKIETPKQYKSLVTPGGNTNLPKQKIYSGTKIIGLSVLHKSSIVPVFSKEEAQDHAKMRRG